MRLTTSRVVCVVSRLDSIFVRQRGRMRRGTWNRRKIPQSPLCYCPSSSSSSSLPDRVIVLFPRSTSASRVVGKGKGVRDIVPMLTVTGAGHGRESSRR